MSGPEMGWWCPTCERSPDPSEVTYSEHHQVCGTKITDCEPPSAAEARVRAAAPKMLKVLLRVRDHFAGCSACSGTQAAVWHDLITEAITEAGGEP